ncbi:asparagine synthase (glutamine-hydrolyzing) [Hazenella sp. IB182357]|uniref:asparagine synthase (glutamine-hydrolyzing) n=1 Tax=Polycladospora coralii TaxID=2771432 RepID=A0A926RTR7_9BACL|nr:asparagine synthase (glutamine-hydrolyzing) [Polycladospora coralii]
MCGITGWVDFDQDLSREVAILNHMNQTQIDRGPDADGIWVSAHAALAHRRLIVIDPEGGVQPMIKHRGAYKTVIVYNGELYNIEELRNQLRSCGHHLTTRSDTELILAAYLEWGEACPKYLNGIFAFAIWDEKEQMLFVARDRIGVKPLFFARIGTSFIFGSEMKSLLAHPYVAPVIDEEGIAELMMIGPARTPGVGVFKDIKELKPGHILKFKSQDLDIKPYWELESTYHEDDFDTTVERVRTLFQQAVERQLVSDVPLGTMLSGGLDSSAISSWAAHIFKRDGRGPLHTYSIDYHDNEKYFHENEFQPNNDAPWVQLMSEYIESKHHRILIDNHELFNHIDRALVARDLPGMTDIDASLLLFAREIKKEMTVVLSGECADEVFGGYPWFHREELINADTFPWARLAADRVPFISPEIIRRIHPLDYLESRYQDTLSEVPRLSEESTIEARMREMFYLNLTRWMPTLLDRKDRMSMAFGLEVRVPFCDHHLVEYAWNIPWSMKAHGNREKGLLRYALQDLLPQEVIDRKKSPYPKTHHPDYLKLMNNRVKKLVEHKNAPLFQLVDRKQVIAFLEQDLSKKHFPWFGQLMNVPALLAYWVQLNQWLIQYQVEIK